MAEQQDMTKEYKLPTGVKEFNKFADRIIKKAGQFADRDSMIYAIAMELIHADPKTAFSDDFFVTRVRKVAANQVASQVVMDIKAKQAELMAKAKAEQEQSKVEVTTVNVEASDVKKTEYERIRDVWYKKLEESGFNDIEQDNQSINRAVSKAYLKKDPMIRQVVQDYYCMAYHFLNEHQFDSELEKIMWEYHTNGLSARNIAKLLNETKITKTSKTAVWKIVKKLEDIMKGLYLSI